MPVTPSGLKPALRTTRVARTAPAPLQVLVAGPSTIPQRPIAATKRGKKLKKEDPCMKPGYKHIPIPKGWLPAFKVLIHAILGAPCWRCTLRSSFYLFANCAESESILKLQKLAPCSFHREAIHPERIAQDLPRDLNWEVDDAPPSQDVEEDKYPIANADANVYEYA